LCAWIAYLAKGKEKLVVSFMGSDVIVKKDEEKYFLLKFMQRLNFWLAKKCDLVIVKSTEMSSNLPSPIDHRVIPNGVNTDLFKELNRHDCRKRLGWDERDFVALFLANPDRIEKNFKLANAGFNLFKNKQDNAKLLVKYDIKNEDLPLYYNAADVMLLTSLYEGSPNVVKEAMSCNCPVISADVGDVKWLLKDSDGSFVIQSDEKSLSDALQKVLENGREGINTRDKIEKLNLGEKQIAHRLLKEYESLFN
jgi:glycosyltransferase involved in cell wall biosynthesis